MTKEQYQTTKKYTQEIIDEILRIEKYEGLSANNLLNNAKSKTNPLHELFNWDNVEAGENWRLYQARIIINEIKILVGEVYVPAFENVTIIVEDGKERVYKTLPQIIDNIDYRKQLVKKALQNVEYWQQQNKMYCELKPIFLVISKTKKSLERKWQKK